MEFPNYPVVMKDINGKKCIKCGHEQCPICLDWCDVLVQNSDDGKWEPCECLYSDNEGCLYEKENGSTFS